METAATVLNVSTAKKLKKIFSFVLTLFLTFSTSIYSSALPVISSKADTVTVDETVPGSLTLTTGDREIINYSTFDIGGSEKVTFVQPSATSVALNRVTGSSRSVIDGSLLANGRIFLVNPNGVFIGSGGIVNAAGFVASSLAISDSDFLSGNYSFTDGASSGAGVHNMGHIIVGQGGYVGLIGKEVVNDGTIDAGYGCVVMAAGDTVSVDFEGDGLVNFAVGGELADVLVRNTGSIHAGGGSILLAASAAADIAVNVVNNTGVIEAMSVEGAAGTIRLVAPGAGIRNEGEITTAGRNGAQGGSVELSAGAVANAGVINVSGSEGATGGVVTLSAGQVTDEGGEIIADEVVEGDGDGADSGSGSDEIMESDEVAAEATGTVVNTGTIEANAGTVDIDSTGDVVNEGVINIEDGLLTIDADGEISNSGEINAQGGAVELDADGVITTSGSMVAETVDEQGAGFEVSGRFNVGTAFMENADGAATFGSGTYSGTLLDPDNIIFTAGSAVVLDGNLTITADSDADGSGYIDMGLGSTFDGAGFDLGLFSSGDSIVSQIANVGNFLFGVQTSASYAINTEVSAASVENVLGSSLHLNVGGVVRASDLFVNSGMIEVLNGGGGLSIGGMYSVADFMNTGDVVVLTDSSGGISVTGDVVNSNGATIDMGGGAFHIFGDLSNSGGSSITVDVHGGFMKVHGDAVNTGLGSTITNDNAYVRIMGSLYNSDNAAIDGGILVDYDFHNETGAACNILYGDLVEVLGTFYNLSGSSITGAADGMFKVHSNFINMGAGTTFTNTGSYMRVMGSLLNLNGASIFLDGRGCAVEGNFYNESGATCNVSGSNAYLSVSNNAYLNNNSSLSSGNDGHIYVGGSVSFLSDAIIELNSGSSFEIVGNVGTDYQLYTGISLTDSEMTIGGNLYNSVHFSVNEGASLSVGGLISNKRWIDIDGGELNALSINNNGAFSSDIGSVVNIVDDLYNIGSGGEFYNFAELNIGGNLSNYASAQFTNTGIVTVGGSVINDGWVTFYNTDGAELVVAGNFSNRNASTFENIGLGASVEIQGSLLNNGGSVIHNGGPVSPKRPGPYDASAVISVAGKFYNEGGASLVNYAPGQINIGGSVYANSNAVIDNYGLIDCSAGMNSNRAGVNVYNTGIMNVANGVSFTNCLLAVDGLVEIGGNLMLEEDAVMTVSDTGKIIIGGSLTESTLASGGDAYVGNSGEIQVSGSWNVWSESALSNSGLISIAGGLYGHTCYINNVDSGIINIGGNLVLDVSSEMTTAENSVLNVGGNLYNKLWSVLDADGSVFVTRGVYQTDSTLEISNVFNVGGCMSITTYLDPVSTVLAGDGARININRDFLVGDLTCLSDVQISVGGDWYGVDSFVAGESVVTFTRAGVSTVDPNGFAFYDFKVDAGKQVEVVGSSLDAVNNITMLDGAVLNLTGDLAVTADSDADGFGAILMDAGSSIIGNGFNLDLLASETSTLGNIDGVGALTVGASSSSAAYVQQGDISVSSFVLGANTTFDSDSSVWLFSSPDNFDVSASGATFRRFAGGDGLAVATAYQITDIYGLQGIDSGSKGLLSKYFVLNNDIDASVSGAWNGGEGFNPIGSDSLTYSFNKTFNGQGFSINTLTINRPTQDYVGLFARTHASRIENLNLDATSTITGRDYVGGLAGKDGYISGCSTSATVSGNDQVGGLIGCTNNDVSNCVSSAIVTGHNAIGGIIGQATGEVSGCSTSATVTGNDAVGGIAGNGHGVSGSSSSATVTGYYCVGGIVGQRGDISDCVSSATVSGYDSVGGIIGYTLNDVSDSSSSAIVTGEHSTGGIIGWASGVSNCSSSATVIGDWSTGGIAGHASSISDSTSTAHVTGNYYVGGLAGTHADVSGCTSFAVVTGDQYVGGLVGIHGEAVNSSSSATVTGNDFVGGLIGYAGGITISNSSSSATVTGYGSFVGGIIGEALAATITGVTVTGTISGTQYVGGIVGRLNRSSISNATVDAQISGSDSVGGLVGHIFDDQFYSSYVGFSSTAGTITGHTNVGQLIGQPSGTNYTLEELTSTATVVIN